MSRIKKTLCGSFKAKDLGEVKRIVGIDVSRDKNGNLVLNQEKYVKTILARYEARFKSKGRLSTNQKLINGKICPGCFKHVHHHFMLQCSHHNFPSPLDNVKKCF